MRGSACERLLVNNFLSRLMRRFSRRQDGGAAIEFALVSIPFISLVFAIMETGIVFFAGQILETAVGDTARTILTGQAQTASVSQSQFKDSVCSRLIILFDCQNGIYLDVKTYTSFGTVTMTSPLDNTGKFVNNFTY